MLITYALIIVAFVGTPFLFIGTLYARVLGPHDEPFPALLGILVGFLIYGIFPVYIIPHPGAAFAVLLATEAAIVTSVVPHYIAHVSPHFSAPDGLFMVGPY
jgi:hypothetical protein